MGVVIVVACKCWAMGNASCGLWVIFLHEFGKFLGEVGCWRVFCVLCEEPFVSCWGYERGRGGCSRWEMCTYAIGSLLIPSSIGGVLMWCKKLCLGKSLCLGRFR